MLGLLIAYSLSSSCRKLEAFLPDLSYNGQSKVSHEGQVRSSLMVGKSIIFVVVVHVQVNYAKLKKVAKCIGQAEWKGYH